MEEGKRRPGSGSAPTGRIGPELRDRILRAFELQPGERIADRYRVEERIGSGGMSDVYRAFDERRGRPVALKVLLAASVPPGSGEVLEQHLDLLRRLDHPTLVRIHDAGEANGVPFVVTQLLEGQTLKQRLRGSGVIAPAEAVPIVTKVLDALEYLHGRGIVHRDVKPQNIMLTPRGPTLLDYGLARRLGIPEEESGERLGTLEYMAPEQARGEPVDHRADLYACAAVLYEALTGRAPFDGDEANRGSRSLPTFPPSARRTVPLALREAVLAGMAVDPSHRFATAGEMRAVLAGTIGSAASDLERVRTRLRRRALSRYAKRLERWAPALLALAVLATGALAWWRSARDHVTGVRAEPARLVATNPWGGEVLSWAVSAEPIAVALGEGEEGLPLVAVASAHELMAYRLDTGRRRAEPAWTFPSTRDGAGPESLIGLRRLEGGGRSFFLTRWSETGTATQGLRVLNAAGERLGEWWCPRTTLTLVQPDFERPDHPGRLWLGGRSDALGGRPLLVWLTIPRLEPLGWALGESRGEVIALNRSGRDVRVTLSSGRTENFGGLLGEDGNGLRPEWLTRAHTAASTELKTLAARSDVPPILARALDEAAGDL